MHVRLTWAFILIAIVVQSCEEVIQSPGSQDQKPILIVDGLLTDELKIHSVKLTQSIPLNYDAPADAMSGAFVTIRDGINTFHFHERTNNTGIYDSDTQIKGEVGKSYTLEVVIGKDSFSASDKMEMVPKPDSITYSQKNAQGFYTWSIPNNNSISPGKTYQWDIAFHHPNGDITEFTSYNFTGLETTALFYLNQMKKDVRFEPGTIIVQKKYSLSDRYYLFLKAIFMETEWKGGLYDTTPANAPTNLNNGAQGFFRVSAVQSLQQQVPK